MPRTQKPNRSRLAGSGSAIDPAPVLAPVLGAGIPGICSGSSGMAMLGCDVAAGLTGGPGDVVTGLNTVSVGLGMTCNAMLAITAGWSAGCSGRDD